MRRRGIWPSRMECPGGASSSEALHFQASGSAIASEWLCPIGRLASCDATSCQSDPKAAPGPKTTQRCNRARQQSTIYTAPADQSLNRAMLSKSSPAWRSWLDAAAAIVVGIGQRSNWNELRPPDVPELLRCAVQDGTVCTAAQLADAAGMTKGGLHRLISKEAAAPSFETLMRLCAVARVSPLAVLGLEPMVVTPEQSSVSALKLERRKENQHHDWAYVKAALRNAMDEQPVVPTAAEFARRHGVCQAQLRREMPGMVSTLSALSRKNRLARLEQAADSLAKGIVEKARMASICGKRASTAEVAEMLGVGRNDIAFRRAMKQVKSAAPAVC